MNAFLYRRRGWAFAAGGAVAVAAAVIDLATSGGPIGAIKTLIAAAIAVAVAGLALTLPGVTWRGALIGFFFVAAGISTWTFTSHPIMIWGILAVEGLVFATWTRPWLKSARDLPRLAGTWLGVAYWVLGIIGAVLVGHMKVATERVAYAGVFALAVMAVVAAVKRPAHQGGGDPSVGIAAALLVAIALLMLAGSGSMFDSVHAVPDNAGARLMQDRFWGGSGLFFQPNALAGLSIVTAIRIGPDRAFAWWQRLGVTGVTCFILFLTNSRTPFGVALIAALVHAVLVLWWRRADLPTYRRPWVAVLTPLVMLGVVLALSGGSNFVFKSRFSDTTQAGVTSPVPPPKDVTSGRVDTWKQVLTDWEHTSVVEKIFGDATTSRAVVTRVNDPGVQLNTDNAAVGAFRRGGVLGLAGFALGVLLLLWRALGYRNRGRKAPAWFTIFAVAVVPSIALEDWLLGGTNGGMWILLLTGEAVVLFLPLSARAPEPPVAVKAGAGAPDAAVTATPGPPARASAQGLG